MTQQTSWWTGIIWPILVHQELCLCVRDVATYKACSVYVWRTSIGKMQSTTWAVLRHRDPFARADVELKMHKPKHIYPRRGVPPCQGIINIEPRHQCVRIRWLMARPWLTLHQSTFRSFPPRGRCSDLFLSCVISISYSFLARHCCCIAAYYRTSCRWLLAIIHPLVWEASAFHLYFLLSRELLPSHPANLRPDYKLPWFLVSFSAWANDSAFPHSCAVTFALELIIIYQFRFINVDLN